MPAAKSKKPNRPAVVRDNKAAVLGICVVLVGMVLAVFGQSLGYGFVNYDDGEYFFSNPHVKTGLTWNGLVWAFQAGYSNNWHPLTWWSLMLDAQLFGPGPMGPHLTNVILHAVNTVLLFLLLRRLTGTLWPGAFVAAAFAIHPLHVESVAWVAERKDVLSGFFFMLTLWMYARYVQNRSVVEGRKGTWRRDYVLTVIFFALGLMSKPMLVTLPLVLLLLDGWPLKRFGRERILRLWLEKVPFFLLSVASCVVTLFAQRLAEAPVNWLPLSVRFENALTAYAAYLGQTLYPVKLAVLYPYPTGTPPLGELVLAAILVVGISAIAIGLRKQRPYLFTGWFWFLGMLVPVIGIVQVGFQARADRYTYLPQIGLGLAVVWLIRDLSGAWSYQRQVLGTAAVIILGAWTVLAARQAAAWRDNLSLWQHAVDNTAFNPIALVNLDVALGDTLMPEQGIQDFKHCIAVMPNYAEAEYDLGTLLYGLKRYDEAVPHLQRAFEISPTYAGAHNNLANVLLAEGRADDAIAQYEKAVEIKPDYVDARYNLAMVLATHHRMDEAVIQYRRTLTVSPDYVIAHIGLANLLFGQGRLDDAIAEYQQAIRLKPDDVEARFNLALGLQLRGQLEESAEQYRQGLQLNPGYADGHGNLGKVLTAQGKLADAAAEFQAALKLDPHNLLSLLGLAWLRATSPAAALRNGDEAIALAQAAEQVAEQVTGKATPQTLDTLAAAYAEAGRFGEAVAAAKQALGLAATGNDSALRDAILARLKLYENNSPYRLPEVPVADAH